MASILRQRRDTAANWTVNNPVIADGQLCFNTTNNIFKIGNGIDNYLDLSVQSGIAGIDGINGISGDVMIPTTTGLILDVGLSGALDTGVLIANSNITFTNIPANGTIVFFVDIQAAGFSVAWVASGYTFAWDTATAPALTTRDLITFERTEGTTVLKAIHVWKEI